MERPTYGAKALRIGYKRYIAIHFVPSLEQELSAMHVDNDNANESLADALVILAFESENYAHLPLS